MSKKRSHFLATLWTLIVLFQASNLSASHLMGADMSYRSLGNGKYKITAKIYRDCQGIAFTNPSFGVFAGTNGSDGCGRYTLSIFRTGIKDISNKCSTSTKGCYPQNTGGTGQGIEEHTYETTVDFSQPPLSNFAKNNSCCEVTFYLGQCCRNAAITTGQAGNDFWTTCMINICAISNTLKASNSSPILQNTPVGVLCCNQPYFFNNGAIDSSDNDSISYALVHAISALPNVSATYSSPFTKQFFMTPYCLPSTSINCTPDPLVTPSRGLFFDTTNGNIIFTPTKCDEVGVVVIEMTERRLDTSGKKWLVVGKTRRDMQLIVDNSCGYNAAPEIVGPYNYSICEGDTLKFNIATKDKTLSPDQSIPDTLSLACNQWLPGATFTMASPSDWSENRLPHGEFVWCPPAGSASNVAYRFTARVSDNHCPRPAVAIRGFSITVHPRATDTRKFREINCELLEISADSIVGSSQTAVVKWSIETDTGVVFYSTQVKDTFRFQAGKTYIVKHSINNKLNCVTGYSDTITPGENPYCDFDWKPDYQFDYYGILLHPLDQNKNPWGKNGTKYTWKIKGVDTVYSQDSLADVKVNLPADGIYEVTMEASLGNSGCICSITKNIRMDRASTTDFDNQIRIFPNPVNETLAITSATGFERLFYSMYDVSGREISAGTLNGSGSHTIDLPNIPNGVYTIRFSTTIHGAALLNQRFLVLKN
jgi:hypothetical protein